MAADNRYVQQRLPEVKAAAGASLKHTEAFSQVAREWQEMTPAEREAFAGAQAEAEAPPATTTLEKPAPETRLPPP